MALRCGKKNFFETAKKPFTKEIATALIRYGNINVNGLYSKKTGKKDDATSKYVNFRLEFKK